MARGIRGAVTALCLSALVGCHDQQWVKPVETSAVFDQSALDFGEVPVGEWREAVIDVRNVGYAPFALLEALELEDDPCYHVEAATDLVPPGQTRKVRVRFHPLREGLIETEVKVATDANNRPEAPVPVRGVGAPARIGVQPSELQFETLEIDSDRVLEVTIQNPVDIPMTLSVQGDGAAHFGADVLEIPPLSTVKVNARFFPRDLGALAARLEVLPCPTCTPIPVSMAGTSVAHAFAFNPAPVPFAETPVHETSQSFTRMTNVTWRPVTIGELVPNDVSFSALTDLRQRTIAPGEMVKVDMQFAARFSGPNTGEMEVRYESDRARVARVGLDARGGHPQLAVTPIAIDFGRLPVGGKVERVVRLTNAGASGTLLFQGADGAGGPVDQFSVGVPRRGDQALSWTAGSAWPTLNAPDLPIAPGGDAIDVPVYFEPTAAGEFEARIRFRSDAPYNGEREVLVKGSAYQTGPCAWRVLPWPSLDFGNVPPDTGAILGFRFENAGTEVCAVKDIHISNDGGGVFWMPGGALTGGVVLQDDAFSAMIAFRSATPGRFTGELQLTVSDPANPTVRLPLEALAQASCLTATPSPVDFGPIRYDCSPEPRTTFVSNACATPVTIDGAAIGPGTSGQYRIVRAPAYPLTLQPGQGFELEVTYDRTVLGQHYSPIWVDVAGEPEPFTIPMWAETNHEGTAVDRFVQGNSKQIDVLFVVSNTTTMQTYQQRLAAAIPGWVSSAQAQGISLHVGVTTTGLVERSASCGGGANGGEAGRLFPVDGSRARFVDASSSNVSTIQQNLAVGTCHNLVQGLETMRMALSSPLVDGGDDPRTGAPNDGNLGFLRGSARLAVVFLSDEEDNSGFSVSGYAQFLDELKGPNMSHRTEAYAIIPKGCTTPTPTPAAQRLEDVARSTGGSTANVCASQGSYASLLSQILSRASGPQADFRLSFPARSAAEIEVLVNGSVAPRSSWSLDAASNSVVFGSGSIPAPGDRIEVRYVSECGTVTR